MLIKSLKSNVYWLYSYIFLSGLYFDRALWVLYLSERGMNMTKVGFLESFLHLIIVFFEIPTGIIADLYGRKISLMIGQFISIFYAFFMYLSGNFYLFTLAFALLGLSITFKSGAQEAFLYDALQSMKEEKKYTKILGNQTAIILISLSIAKLVGGFIAEYSWGILYLSIFVIQLIGLIPLSMLLEPKHKKENDELSIKFEKYDPVKSWKEQIREGMTVWKKEPIIRKPMIQFITLVTIIIVIIFYAQEYFAQLGYSESEIGIIFTIESLLGVLAAKVAYRLEHRWSAIKIINNLYFLFILFLIVFSFFTNLIAVISLFILGMITEFIEPIFSNFIQIRINSKIRATVFSIISLMNSIAIAIIFFLFGYAIDKLGFQTSYIILLLFLYSILVLQKLKLLNIKSNQ